jgi:hypothetical protein
VQRFFRKIEIAEQANQRGEDTARFGAVNRIHRAGDVLAFIARHGGIVLSGTAAKKPAVRLRKTCCRPDGRILQSALAVGFPPGGAQSPTCTLTEPARRAHRVAIEAASRAKTNIWVFVDSLAS